MSLRRLLPGRSYVRSWKKKQNPNTTLTIAFTSDLHEVKIKPLKHASTIYKQLSEPKLLVDAGDAFAGMVTLRGRTLPAWAGSCACWATPYWAWGTIDLELGPNFRAIDDS